MLAEERNEWSNDRVHQAPERKQRPMLGGTHRRRRLPRHQRGRAGRRSRLHPQPGAALPALRERKVANTRVKAEDLPIDTSRSDVAVDVATDFDNGDVVSRYEIDTNDYNYNQFDDLDGRHNGAG